MLTFSNVIADANDAALRSELKSLYTEYVAEVAPAGEQPEVDVIIAIVEVKGEKTVTKYYHVKSGAPVDVNAETGYVKEAEAEDVCGDVLVTVDGANIYKVHTADCDHE